MKPLDARILDIYETLTPLEKRLANIVLEHQRDLASYSATELARQADVSKATAARLFKRLGYGSYDEARRQSRALRAWGSPLSRFDTLERHEEDGSDLVAHLRTEIANLSRSFEGIRPESFAAAVDMLLRAERIWLIGFRGSHPVAELAAFWLKYLKKNVQFLPSGWMTFAEDVIDIGPGDTVFAVGLRRRPAAFRALVQNARESGAGILLLTDLSASATARLADVVLRCHSRSTSIFDSLSTAVSMVNFLLGSLALRQGEAVRDRLRRIEDLADRLDAIGPPAVRRSVPSGKTDD